MYKLILIILTAILINGCNVIHPYTVDIQQGNIVDKTMLDKLHLGMTKTEVNNLLGTPILHDTLDKDSWVYVYTNQVNDGKIVKKKLLLEFKNNKLVYKR